MSNNLSNPDGARSWLERCRAGNYYGRLNVFNYVLLLKDIIYFTPHPVPVERTIDRIACYASVVGDAAARVRMGIYADDGTGNPGALLVDGGEMNFSSGVGIKAAVVALTLPTPLVWLAFTQTFTAVSPTVAIASGAEGCPLGVGGDLGAIGGGTVANAYGALPAAAPAITTLSANPVILAVRRA